VGAGTTLQQLLTAINDSGTGFGAAPRPAVASLSAGRIVLTDGTTGDSQLGVSLTVSHSGSPDISFGTFSTAGGTVGRTIQVSSGADASLRVDGQLITRSSNTITDAISGVSLNLLTAEPGTTVNVTVGRDSSGISQKLQAFAQAYNGVQSFVKTNTAAGGALAHNSAIRSMAQSLTSSLLTGVTGLGGAYTTAAMAGLHHDSKGVLSLDTTTFAAALQTNFDDVKRLFTLTGTASDAEVTFISASAASKPSASPYAVAITQAATLASVTGAIWATYVTSGLPDTMQITDVASGAVGSISLANGDSIDTVLQKLNALFAAKRMSLQASKTGDSRLKLTATEYGTTGGFAVAFTPGAGGDGTALLGITGQSYAGLNVAGTINGAVASGSGQFLTGASNDASAGIVLRYAGTSARAAGTLSLSLGVGGMLSNIATILAGGGGAGIAAQEDASQTRVNTLTTRISDLQARLDARRAALTAQFVAMEAALAKAQALSATLTSQINALQSTKQ
jgi:flagellar hook-associated protein 2